MGDRRRRWIALVALALLAACGGATAAQDAGTDAVPGGDAGQPIADATVDEDASQTFPDVNLPEAPPFVDAGCVDGSIPPGLGSPFACGDASCWSGSEYCVNGFIGNGPVCEPLPCRCGALPTCSCLPGCPFESCVAEAGAIYQQCSCP